MTPDPSDPEGLAPIQHQIEQAVVAKLELQDFSIVNRQVHTDTPRFWVSFQITGTCVSVSVAREMAVVSIREQDARFEAQGYRTPEEFCTAVVQYATASVWPYPPTDQWAWEQINWLDVAIMVTMGGTMTMVVLWLLAKVVG